MHRLRLFGTPRLLDPSGQALTIGKRARGILCFLALEHDQRASRERLSAMFWQDRGTAQARASLRQTLLEIRSALSAGGADLLIADREMVTLDVRHVQTDLEAAEAAGSAAEFLEALKEIGSQVPLDVGQISDRVDEWREGARLLVETRLRNALVRQLDAAETAGDDDLVAALADAWLARNPTDEPAAGRAIAAELRRGGRAAAQRRLQQLAHVLHEQCGRSPDPGIAAMLDHPAAAVPAALTPPDAAAARPQASPAPPGRDHRRRQRRLWPAVALAAVLSIGAAALIADRLPGPATDAPAPVLAVLPFAAADLAADDAAFADGFADELTDGLAADPRLRTVGHATATRLHRTAALRKDAYRQLGVTNLLTGTVRPAANHAGLQIAISLIDSRTGAQTWQERIDLPESNVPSAAREVTALVARRLLDERGKPGPATGPSPDLRAYLRIVKARRHIQSREANRLIEARDLARQAVEIAPLWAEAHAVRSIAASLMQNYTNMPVAPLQAEAGAAAAQALSRDPKLALAHEAQSLALEGVDGDEAMAAASRAVLLRPGKAEARRRLAWLLRADGQHLQAVAELEAAIRIDPFWYLPYIDLGISLGQTNQIGALLALQQRHAALGPPAGERDLVLANTLLDAGRAGEAAVIAGRLVRTEPGLTYAGLTWVDALMALFAADAIPRSQFELNTSPAVMALARRDLVGAARAANAAGTGRWDDPETAVVLGHAMLATGRGDRLLALFEQRYPNRAAVAGRPPQGLALGRHPGLYPAMALAAAGRTAEAAALRGRVASDVARLERLGLARSQSGIAGAALATMAGDEAAALDRLETAMAAQWAAVCHGPIWIGSDPLFQGLRQSPRFQALLLRCRDQLDQQRAAAGLPPLGRLP